MGGKGTGALAITGPIAEAYGQIGVAIYACGPPPFHCPETLCPETLQATPTLPMPPNASPGQLIYTLKTLHRGNTAPAANHTLQGYSLKWTAPPDNDVRYFALYSRDDQAPRVEQLDQTLSLTRARRVLAQLQNSGLGRRRRSGGRGRR